MNKLDYSVSLREQGLVSNDLKKKMRANGFTESEIQYNLKKSDEIFLAKLINNKKSKSKEKSNDSLKMIGLALSLILLIGAFFGYVKIGLAGLFIIWSLVGYSANRK